MNKEKLGKKIKEAAYLEGDFTLRSGKKSNYYLDKYLFETKPEILKALAQEMKEMLPPRDQFDRLAGPELGAVALTSALSLETGIPFVIVKKESKGYGTDKLIEGKFNSNDRFVLIEDILTTGGASLKAAQTLEKAGGKLVLILGTIDRQEGARENIEKAGYNLKAVFSKSDLGI